MPTCNAGAQALSYKADMPIYEYECLSQKHRFEVIQKFNEPAVAHCTVCGSPVQKLLSSPAIQFKGSGWYITDYARKGNAESSTASSDKSTSETSKPADGNAKESKTDVSESKSSS
jgi:putative FmdB family regulatory protein